ncbi:MAG: peptidase M28, partial [Acidobacteria bacterium]|nr:peptidase M28 [Acidobacteriota bacterium]
MRRRYLLGLFFIASLAVVAYGQKAQVAATSVAETNIRKHIAYLASDKLEGRRTGEPGALTAAGYVADMFANYRLRPGARGK